MKKLLENIAVGLVILLSLGVVGLVVQYNMLSDNANVETEYEEKIVASLQSKSGNEEKQTSYLDSLEGYEEVDVKVDPGTEASNLNIAVIKVETKKEGVVQRISSAVESVENKERDKKTDPGKEDADLNGTTEAAEETQNVVEASDEGELGSDPLSEIVSDIDSIIDESESQK